MTENLINSIAQLVSKGGMAAIWVVLILQLKHVIIWGFWAFFTLQMVKLIRFFNPDLRQNKST